MTSLWTSLKVMIQWIIIPTQVAASGPGRATGQSWLDTALFSLLFMAVLWAAWCELLCPIRPQSCLMIPPP